MRKVSQPKVTFYVLHMNYGGVETSVAQVANMLADNFAVEIVSVYDFKQLPFVIDQRVQITYLTSQTPNREELKLAFKTKKGIWRELIKAASLWLNRRRLVKRHIKHNSAAVLISTRMLFHDLICRYGRDDQLKICQEHVDHKNNHHYLRKVLTLTKKADYLMPVSDFLSQDYAQRTKTPIKYIPHAVTINNQASYAPSKNLIAVGRLSPEKGFADLIEVFAEVYRQDSEYRLDIFGAGIEQDGLADKVERLGLASVVTMHGFQPSQVLKAAYAKAGLLVMCSHEESFGLVFLESFANKVPAIAFDSARGACEILSQGGGLLIKNRDIQAMAQAIVDLSRQDRLKLSREAFSVARKYDINNVKRSWGDFISTALKERQ